MRGSCVRARRPTAWRLPSAIRAALALHAALASSLLATPSRAQTREGRATIAVLAAQGDQAVVEQLALDLAMLGFAVVTSPLARPEEPAAAQGGLEAVRSQAAREGWAAAIWLEPAGDGAWDVWVIDRVTGKTVQRRLGSGPAQDARNARVLSQRVVELLRASFRELDAEASRPRGEPPPPAAVTALIRPDGSGPAFNAGLALWGSGGGTGRGWAVMAGARWLLSASWALDLHGVAPVTTSSIDEPEGQAKIAPWVLAGGVRRAWWLASRRLVPDVGLVLGAARVVMEGRAEPPFVAAADDVWRPVGAVRAGLAWLPWRGRLGLRLDLWAGGAVGAARVAFVGREVASWGLPFMMASLGLDVMVP